VVVYHGGPCVHANLACAHFEAKVVVDVNVVAGGEEGDDVLVLPVIDFLKPRQIEVLYGHVEELLGRGQVEGLAYDLLKDF
jgi:hypothetical protein